MSTLHFQEEVAIECPLRTLMSARVGVPGGWIYEHGNVFVPDPAAPHVRDDRRLKLREGFMPLIIEDTIDYQSSEHGKCGITEDRLARTFTAVHADGSETDHATRLEAHDALIASGSESPFEVVVGVVPKAKAEGGAS